MLSVSSGGTRCTWLYPCELGGGLLPPKAPPYIPVSPNRQRVQWWVRCQWRLSQHTCAFLRITFPYCCAGRAVRMTQLSTPFLLSHKYSLFKTSPTYTFILTILVLAITCLHCTPVSLALEEILTIASTTSLWRGEF